MYVAIVLLFLLLQSLAAQSQSASSKSYPKNYFRNPLYIAQSFAGNFGDLRTNHYHMGLDFRTNQQENLSVIAAADGYVSHIRIEPYGYGRAIFITHPNGYTTVYGHLNEFYSELESYVHDRQYQTKSWRQDIDFSPQQFPVQQGQFIAWSGNTGGSQGPHLHFEIRDSGLENGHNRNPMLFGLGVQDHVPPVLYRLGVFNRNESVYENSPNLYALQKKKTADGWVYMPASSVIKVPAGKFSLGVGMEDKTDNSFLFGIYQCSLYVDDSLRSSFALNECVYEDSRYINAGIDYYTRYNGGSYMQHLSRLPGNEAPYFDRSAGDGVLELLDDSIHHVAIEVTDVAGNISLLQLQLQRDSSVSFKRNFSENWVQKMAPQQVGVFENKEVQLVLDEQALYDTLNFRYMATPSTDARLSVTHSIADYRLPVHDSFTLRIKLKPEFSSLPDSVRNKTLMVISSGKKNDAQRCIWKGAWAEAKWWNFGNFYLKYDNQPPALRAVNVYDSATFVKDQKLVFDAKDESSDLQSFNGYIDGEWVIFRQKDDRYTYDFDEHCLSGWHTLQVVAVDMAGNQSTYQCSFFNGKN